MFVIQIKPAAILMAKEAYNWYEEQKAGLGDLFLAELSRTYFKLEKSISLSKTKKQLPAFSA